MKANENNFVALCISMKKILRTEAAEALVSWMITRTGA